MLGPERLLELLSRINKYTHKSCCIGITKGSKQWRRPQLKQGMVSRGPNLLTPCSLSLSI